MKEGRKQEYPEKTPGDELQNCMIAARLMTSWMMTVKAVAPFRPCIKIPARLLLFAGWVPSQLDANLPQGRICSDKGTCCHTQIASCIFLVQSQYTDTGPTSPDANPMTPEPGKVANEEPILQSLFFSQFFSHSFSASSSATLFQPILQSLFLSQYFSHSF